MRVPIDVLQREFKLIYPSQFKISQGHGENPAMYGKFGLNGHNGIDIACPTGSNIIAPCKLEIINRSNDTGGYGMYVRARSNPFVHDGLTFALEMVFAHLQGYIASLGAIVDVGVPIAISDNTGNSTGPHVHWGVRLVQKTDSGWKTVDEDNGFSGYFDQSPLIDYKEALPTYDGKVVYSGIQNGAMHYEFVDGKFNWIPDEFAMSCKGYLFSEAVKVPVEYIATPVRGLVAVDPNSHEYKESKQLLRLLVENNQRAKELNKKYV